MVVVSMMLIDHRRAFHRALLLSSLLLLLLNRSNTVALQSRSDDNDTSNPTTTLREYLVPHGEGAEEDLYLAMGPAFFGFYGYFGALAGIEDELSPLDGSDSVDDRTTSLLVERKILRGVSGASSGAIAAILLASGISPHRACEFAKSLELADFADLGGLGAFLRGDKLESIINNYLLRASPINVLGNTSSTDVGDEATASDNSRSLYLEDALIPVAVSATNIHPQFTSSETSSWFELMHQHFTSSKTPSWFDLMRSSWSYIASTYIPTPKILRHGSMARAARASACFPVLFEPVGWVDRSSKFSKNTNTCSSNDAAETCSSGDAIDYSLLIDGGIFDIDGYNGLKEIIHTIRDNDLVDVDDDEGRIPQRNKIRVLNMVVGSFLFAPPGPETISRHLGVAVDSVLSLSIMGLPQSGPLAMKNGHRAMLAARKALRDAMDRPLIANITITSATTGVHHRKQQHHFVLEIDASTFVDEEL